MACPAEDVLVALARGELDGAARDAAAAHLDDCDTCRRAVAALARDDADARPRIGRYQLLAPVGAGAMGVVFAAHDPELDRKVALKLLRRERGGDDGLRLQQRLVDEARALARLAHPNVIAAFDVGREGDEVYLAMELAEGQTLAAWLRAAPRPLREIVRAFAQAGAGLAAAHAAGIVHRDFKPDNVLIDRDGRVRVTDFGLASGALVASGAPPGDVGAVALTRTGALAGTPAYMAPEQLDGGAATARSDQFSFAVALWEAVTGARPFRGDTLPALRAAIAGGAPAPGPRRAPARLRAVIARGLAEEPARRWPDVRALVAALERWGDRAPRRRAVTAAAIALAAAAGGLAVIATGGADAPRCDDGAAQLASLWPAATRARAARALGDGPAAARALAAVDGALSGFRTAWADARDRACRAARVERVESEATLARRTTCLDLERRQVETLIAVLADAPVDPAQAIAAMRALPAPDACSGAAITSGPPPPGDPALRAAALALERRLAEADALRLAGRYADARRRADDVAAEATRRGLADVALHARVVRATTDRADHDPAVVRAEAQAAAAQALELGDDLALADAMTTAAGSETSDGNAERALTDAELAAAALRRAGGDPSRAVQIERRRCEAVGNDLDEARARTICEAARAAAAARDPESTIVASIDLQLCDIAFWAGRYDDAVDACRRGAALYRKAYGDEHLAVFAEEEDEALALAYGGHADAAARMMRPAAARRPQYASIWDSLYVALRGRDRVGALDAAERGLAVCRIQGDKYCQMLGVAAADALLDLGDVEGANATIERAAALAITPHPADAARLELVRARVRHARRDDGPARLALARATAVLDAAHAAGDTPLGRLRAEVDALAAELGPASPPPRR